MGDIMDGQEDEPNQEPPMEIMREKRDDAVVDQMSKAMNGLLSEYRREIKSLERQIDNLQTAREVERERYHLTSGVIN